MKKHLITLSIALVSLLFVGTSCTNLDENVYDAITEENLDFNDEATIESLSASAYANLRFMYWGYYGLMDLVAESSDLYVIPLRLGVGWGDYYISYHKHQVNAEDGNMNSTDWYYNYVCIGYCNRFCKIMENNIGLDKLTAEQKLSYAKIRCIRALCYYILFDNFRYIPLLTGKEEESVAGYLPKQENPDVTFGWIESELKAILDDLGTEHVFGHPNRYVAEMILAKMYLNHNAWFSNIISADNLRAGQKSGNDYASSISTDWYKKAIDVVKDIIDNGGYTLEPNYKNNFLCDLSANTECIFAIPLDKTYASHNYTVCESLITAGAAAYGYTKNCWNGGSAIPQFMNTYSKNDTRFDDTWAHDQQYKYTADGGAQSGDALKTAEADLKGTVNVSYTRQLHSVDNPGSFMLEGYRNVKYEIVAGSDGTFGDDVDFFRLADAYFIAAECALRLGGSYVYSEQDAVNFVNKVRARAFTGRNTKTMHADADPTAAKRTLADLKGGSCYAYGHDEYTNYGNCLTDDSGQQVLDASGSPTYLAAYEFKESCHVRTNEGGDDIEFGGLLDDLAWEFALEHHRRQDLIRFTMKNGQNVWNGKSWFCKDRTEDVSDTHYNIFPIYIDYLNGNINLVQAPGF